jgi:hypothetical protein
MTAIILLSIVVVGLAMLAMAVGAIFSNRCLRGSCGGPEVLGPGGESLSCNGCPKGKGRRAEGRTAGSSPFGP